MIADYGLDKEDQDELKTLQGASVEFGYMADLTVENSEEAVRLYSKPEGISTFQVTEGRLPEADGEIALADFWKDRYQIGQTITFSKKEEGKSFLKSQLTPLQDLFSQVRCFLKKTWEGLVVEMEVWLAMECL